MNPDLEIFDAVISTEMVYHDVSADILTDFHPWMKTEFFYADAKLLELSKEAVRSLHSGVINFEKNCQVASAIARNITIALISELWKNRKIFRN